MDIISKYLETTWGNKQILKEQNPFAQKWEEEYVKCFCTLSNLHQFDWKRYVKDTQPHHEFRMNDENAAYYVWSENRENGYIQNTNNQFKGFDWNSYLKHNRDLGSMTEQEAFLHWIQFGRHEHRIVDARMCLNSLNTHYSFVKTLLCAYLYYEPEPISEFDWERYISNYPDLHRANIRSETQAYSHWVLHGRTEGRNAYIVNSNEHYTTFHWKSFVEHNQTLKNNITNEISAYECWRKWRPTDNTVSRIKIKRGSALFKNDEYNNAFCELLHKEFAIIGDSKLDTFIANFIEKYVETKPLVHEYNTHHELCSKYKIDCERQEKTILYFGEIEEQRDTLDLIVTFKRVCYFDKTYKLKICFGKIYQHPDFIELVKSLLIGFENNIVFQYNLTHRELCYAIQSSAFIYNQSKNPILCKLLSEFESGSRYMSNFKDMHTSNVQLYNKFIVFVPYCDIFHEFIIECLCSIQNQHYTNYEVIILNDGGSNMQLIQKFIEDKSNYTIIGWDKNLGPGYSKYKMVEHVQRSHYGKNDIMIFIDGDDYLSTEHAFSIINSYYVKTNCWATCGNYTGRWSDNSYDSVIKYIENENRRQCDEFIYPPVRTCKIGLIDCIDKNIFKIGNSFIQKCTDMMLFVNILELCNSDQIQYVHESTYVYREHDQNTYKIIASSVKTHTMNIIKTSTRLEQKTDTIHLLLTVYNCYNLAKMVTMICGQTVIDRITLHILHNNDDVSFNDYVSCMVDKYQGKLNIKLHQIGDKVTYSSSIIIAREIRRKYLVDYLIMIDCDQIYDAKWCENILKNSIPLSVTSWSGNQFKSYDCSGGKSEFHEILDKMRCGETGNRKYCGYIIYVSLFLHI